MNNTDKIINDNEPRRGDMPLRYFNHPSSLLFDSRVNRLIRKHGMAGYGRYMTLLEYLACNTWHRLPMKDELDTEIIADILKFENAADATAFVEQLVTLGLLEFVDNQITSPIVNEQADLVNARAQGGKTARRTIARN